jgi:hypothetical protein
MSYISSLKEPSIRSSISTILSAKPSISDEVLLKVEEMLGAVKTLRIICDKNGKQIIPSSQKTMLQIASRACTTECEPRWLIPKISSTVQHNLQQYHKSTSNQEIEIFRRNHPNLPIERLNLPWWPWIKMNREVVWDMRKGENLELFQTSDWRRQTGIIFALMKGKNPSLPPEMNSEHPIVSMVISIARGGTLQIKDLIDPIIQWIIDALQNNDTSEESPFLENQINLSPCIPQCKGEAREMIVHCEARIWQTDFAYCPRIHRACNYTHTVQHRQSEGTCGNQQQSNTENYRFTSSSGVRHTGEPGQPLSQWDILDLIEASETKIVGQEDFGGNNALWLHRFGGWINRLNDIRRRARCSSCTRALQLNWDYASLQQARLGVTVQGCRSSDRRRHDRQVYLHYCNNCHGIIDSRESRRQINGYYLCIRCGSGERGRRVGKLMPPGSRCPRCNSNEPMQPMKNSQSRAICLSCRHQITSPAPKIDKVREWERSRIKERWAEQPAGDLSALEREAPHQNTTEETTEPWRSTNNISDVFGF